MEYLGYNYRLSDIQCALALSQLDKLPDSIRRRQAIAERYDTTLAETPMVTPLAVNSDVTHAYHIYPVQVDLDRDKIFAALRAENIGVNVHYLPVYRHPYYQRQGYTKGLCPVAEAAYERMISLPIFPGMTDEDVGDVLTAVEKVVGYYLA
jgi:perosamine synthetase